MLRNYLKLKYHIIFFTLLFVIVLFGFFLFAFCILAIYALICFLFRRKVLFLRDNLPPKAGLILSPITGKVLKVRKNWKRSIFGNDRVLLELKINFWNEYGIYFPTSGEVLDFFVKGRSIFDTSKEPLAREVEKMAKGLAFIIEEKNLEQVALQFPKSLLGIFPKIKIMPGDNGQTKACLGHFPLGGKVLLYLPEKYEILVSKGDRLVAGETLIATRPEFSH
jgi:phosphatidylserine decarboxylase